MEWNRIMIDNYQTSISNSKPIFLEIDSQTKLDITVKENVTGKLVILGYSNYDISIKLECGSSLLVNSLNKNNSVNANVFLMKDSLLNYNHSVLANTNSINNFNISHLDNSSISYLTNSGINQNEGKLFFNIDGKISQNLHNITCNQSSKIINFNNGNSKIIPNLVIDSNDIIANHSAYIGEINEEELFYMKSRGISEEDIKKLVYKATLIGNLYLKDEKEMFNKIINEWW